MPTDPTDADREAARALMPLHARSCGWDDRGGCTCFTAGVRERIAQALADERERARAPFLALADQYDAHRAKLLAEGTWKSPLPFLELAAEDIRRIAQEPTP